MHVILALLALWAHSVSALNSGVAPYAAARHARLANERSALVATDGRAVERSAQVAVSSDGQAGGEPAAEDSFDEATMLQVDVRVEPRPRAPADAGNWSDLALLGAGEVLDAFGQETQAIFGWNWVTHMFNTSRYHGRRYGDKHHPGIEYFWMSAEVHEWFIFWALMILLGGLHCYLSGWGSQHRGKVLAVWVGVALLFNLGIRASRGPADGEEWFAGYIMEVMCALDNVLVLLLVAKSFRGAPPDQVRFALFVVVCGQILMLSVMYMGLAHWFRHFVPLRYILGVWLIFMAVGVSHMSVEEVPPEESTPYCIFSYCFGRCFDPEWNKDGRVFVWKDGGLRLTMLAALIVVLSVVEMLLEVDVALTKIEMFQNLHLSLSSSAVASWMMPELFLIADELLDRFPMLKYGISTLLVYFGLEMLLADLIIVPQFWNCLIMLFILCVSASLPDITLSPNKAAAQLLACNAAQWEAASDSGDECTWDYPASVDAGLIGRTVRTTPPGHGVFVSKTQKLGIVTGVVNGKLRVRFEGKAGAEMLLPLGHVVELRLNRFTIAPSPPREHRVLEGAAAQAPS